jgi:hypothetical protein
MIPLTVLRLSFTFWKRTLDLSKRLSGPTWLALALINASIAISAFSLYRAEEVSESAIPPVYYSELPLPDFHNAYSEILNDSFLHWRGGTDGEMNFIMVEEVYPSHSAFWILIAPEVSSVWLHESSRNVIVGSEWSTHLHLMLPIDIEHTQMGWQLPRWPSSMDRVVIQAPSNPPSLLTPVQQLAAILVGIVTTMLAILNTFLAWQVYRRAKAQEILLQLQIAKLQCELAEMKARDEQARTEARESSLVTLS